MTSLPTLHALLLTGVGLVGCMDTEPELSSTEQLATVADYGSSGCSTAVVIGLSKQISDEVGCIDPTSLVPFTPSARLTLSSNAVLPYLAKGAADHLVAASEVGSLQINSAFRSIAQQYLLYRWFQNGRCGITAAAKVGRSNHESGRAVDVSNYSSRISILANRGWAHDVPGDPVHFDHTSSPDIRGLDTKAFQRLWNRNNPNDTISEDGAYGPQTEARLKKAPATGFALGPSCGTRAFEANIVAVDGPDRVAPDAKLHYTVTIKNPGTVDWPATTRLVMANGAASDLFDADTWSSPTEYGEIGSVAAAGAQLVLELDVKSPNVTVETPVFQQLSLTHDGQSFGTINLALTVTPDPEMADTSTDSDDANDEPEVITGGCSTGGTPSWLALALPALAMFRRRRR